MSDLEKDPPGEGAAEGAAPAAPPDKAAKSKRARTPRPAPTEREINSPDRLTLVLLASVFAVTVVSWGAARFSCNLHPPESREPAKQPTTRLAATPKDAAIELQQRLRSLDFGGALELSKGELGQQIEAERRACESRAEQCEEERKSLASKVITSGVLLSQDEQTAEVRVSSHVGDKKETYGMRLERDGPIWKGVARERTK